MSDPSNDERDEQQAPHTRHPLDTQTAEIVAAIVAGLCVLGAGAIIVAALMGWLPWS